MYARFQDLSASAKSPIFFLFFDLRLIDFEVPLYCSKVRSFFSALHLGCVSKIFSSPENPIEGIKLLKVPSFKPRELRDWEFNALYNSASVHFKPILLCAYMTGMRRSEIEGLKWKDVDLKVGYILVVETKNGESRTIPISTPLLNALSDISKDAASEYVFTGPDGKPYTSPTAWKRNWATFLKKSGIEKCRFHDLRHTFVSNLIVGEKEDYTTVMGISGHKDIRMLLRYSNTREEAKKAAIEKLGDRLNTQTMDTYLDTSKSEVPKSELKQ